jgi:hypothetical protein
MSMWHWTELSVELFICSNIRMFCGLLSNELLSSSTSLVPIWSRVREELTEMPGLIDICRLLHIGILLALGLKDVHLSAGDLLYWVKLDKFSLILVYCKWWGNFSSDCIPRRILISLFEWQWSIFLFLLDFERKHFPNEQNISAEKIDDRLNCQSLHWASKIIFAQHVDWGC